MSNIHCNQYSINPTAIPQPGFPCFIVYNTEAYKIVSACLHYWPLSCVLINAVYTDYSEYDAPQLYAVVLLITVNLLRLAFYGSVTDGW